MPRRCTMNPMHGSRPGLQLWAIDVPAMVDLFDQHEPFIPEHLVEDPIVADPHSIEILPPLKLGDPSR